MDEVIKNKMGLELETSLSSGYKTSSKNFLYYLLSDQVWWCNIKRFLSYSKNLCKPIHDIINYSTSICSFESRKCRKEEEKLQKFEYLRNEKSFLDETKNIFQNVFEGLSFGEKTKIW